MTDKQPTRGQQVLADLIGMLRARYSLIVIITREELRVDRALIEAGAQARMAVEFWSCVTGRTNASGEVLNADERAAIAFLRRVQQSKEKRLYVMHDLSHGWMDPTTVRAVREAAKSLPARPDSEAATLVLMTPRASSELPPELAAHATVIEFPLPDRVELGEGLDDLVSALPDSVRKDALNGDRDSVIEALVALTMQEAENVVAKSVAMTRKVDALAIGHEKRRLVERGKGVSWIEPNPRGLAAIGGLAGAKAWALERIPHFSPEAIAFGLEYPKGALLVGQPGCGKSEFAKCLGTAFKCPVVRFDAGGQKSKYVGESEQNIRATFALAETLGKCVLWWDEIDKALASTSGPQGDGGVSTDQLGTFLTWRQECKAPVFVLATANSVTGLPPALFRAGRFDAVFFVDLPNPKERAEIAQVCVAGRGRTLSDAWAAKVSQATEGFSGAEIAALVPKALSAAFAKGREFDPKDMLTEAAKTIPQSRTSSEEYQALRNWAQGRAMSAAGTEQQAPAARSGRQIDLGAAR